MNRGAGYEVDYLPIGDNDGGRSGDAIAMRFWLNDPDQAFVITIDGGTRESGTALVQHIREHYRTSIVNIAFLTHPDADHSSGLRVVLEELSVKRLFMCEPWNHVQSILPILYQADNRVTLESIYSRLLEEYAIAYEVSEIAKSNGVPIVEPFSSGQSLNIDLNTTLFLLGPSRETYLSSWLPRFDCFSNISVEPVGTLEKLSRVWANAVNFVREEFDKELLTDPVKDAVNAENNSSTVFCLKFNNEKMLFCGDAGVPGITEGLALGMSNFNLLPSEFEFFHVPHHGSKRNLGPSLLNAIYGPPSTQNFGNKVAFISATINDPKHPSARVTNALNRRRVSVFSTQGNAIRHSHNAPPRIGWSNAVSMPFKNEVEED